MKAPLGSTVYYMGQEWTNECISYQPVFGISEHDAIRSTVYKIRFKKSFAKYLQRAIKRVQEQEKMIKEKQRKESTTLDGHIDILV